MRRRLPIFLIAPLALIFLAPAGAAAFELKDCIGPEAHPVAAIAACSKIIELATSRRMRAAAYSNRGVAHRTLRHLDEAMADQNASIRTDPTDFSGWGNRALIWMEKGEYDRAIDDLNQCLRIKPDQVTCQMNRGTIWLRKGNYDRAIADHTVAIGLNPREWTAYHNRGLAWKEKGDLARALEDVDLAISISPREALAYSTRGELWRLMGDLDRAMVDLNKAISVVSPDLSPSQNPMSVILLRRGDVWRYRGEFDRALADYDEALRYDKDMPLIYTNRGITHERLGDVAQARADFQKALSPTEFVLDTSQAAQVTARARLAALDSGAAEPSILPAPAKVVSQSVIPTPAVSVPNEQPAAANQGRRVALVIGNSAYQRVPQLPNPRKDAEAVAASLRNIGFQVVTLASDATRDKLTEGLRAFAAEADTADWAMVYYAGHGLEVNGINYLIPVDAVLKTDRDVQFEAVPLDHVLASIDGARKLKLVVLDACRDNPFAPKIQKTGARDTVAMDSTAGGTVGTRSIGRGLGEVKVQGASLVVFAAKHGQVALDGEGGNSPFAVAMVQRIATPGVEINKIFRLVRDDVMEATAGRQEPYTYGSLPGREDFFFVAAK
jgi:tetratricopeptide (TPR) repeat protein